jgi:hypothetical protein
MRTCLLLTPLLAAGCDPEGSFSAASRILDGFSYVDAGAASVGGSQEFTVPLFSKGQGAVRIFEIATEDVSIPEGATSPAFVVDDAKWAKDCDRDEDGTADCLDLEKYSNDSEDDTLALPVTFAPTIKGYYEGILTIWSNDNSSAETAVLPGEAEDSTKWAIWRVQLRGLGDYACGRTRPDLVDFGHRPAVGGNYSAAVNVENCGVVPLQVTSLDVDVPEMEARTLPPLTVLPGKTEEIVVAWTVANTDPVEGHLTLASNSEALSGKTVRLIGNNCEETLDPASYDRDYDGWTTCGGDCDDNDVYVNPSASETPGDNVDNDCDGETDEVVDDSVGKDDDGDGCSESGGDCGGLKDCDDADPNIGPHADEVYNQIDDDCDGKIDDETEGYDDDGDGWSEAQGDCDDTEALVSPDATEVVDGRDNDCDGIVDEGGPGYDDDGDGYLEVETDRTLDDCDDQDPWVFVGAREYCDGYDNDCDGLVDDGDDDVEGGACTFVPTRKADAGYDDTGTAASDSTGGCSAAPSLDLSWLAVLGAAALVRRRRGD